MPLDLIYLALLVIFLIRGFQKGMLVAVCSILALIIGSMAALKLSGTISGLLFDVGKGRWAPLITYLLIFLLVAWGIKLLASLIQRSLDAVALGWLNRIGGAVLYGLMVSVVASIFLWLLNAMSLLSQDVKASAWCYSLLEPLAPALFRAIGTIIPVAGEIFEELSRYFEMIDGKIKSDVGAHR